MNNINNFLQLVDIEDIIETNEYTNMVDITVDIDNSFMLSNGIISHNSANSAFRKYRTPELMGSFSLGGKFINVSEIANKKLVENKEAVDLMACIGLKLGQPIDLKTLRYGKILIYTDADCLQKDTMIVTKLGYKKISDISYDDEVLTHTGEFKKIVKIVQKDIFNYIKIRVNGNDIICSENHKLLVFRDGDILEVEAKNIKHTDFFLLMKK
jgi:intein/homing endonuclease